MFIFRWNCKDGINKKDGYTGGVISTLCPVLNRRKKSVNYILLLFFFYHKQ